MRQNELENQFSPEMALAYSFIEYTDRNLFITGKAGTGKTYFLTRLAGTTSKRHVVLAPTGVAAVNAKGVTVNSLFQLPPGFYLNTTQRISGGSVYGLSQIVDSLNYSAAKNQLLRQLELIIIDEVSMLRCDQLELIDLILKKVRGNDHAFGGIQMALMGDLFQLPPIVPNDVSAVFHHHYRSAFFFEAEVIKQSPLLLIEFNQVYRQADDQFIGILNRIRTNQVTDGDLSLLNERYRPSPDQAFNDTYISLTSHNHEANAINTARLNELPGPERVFAATITGDFQDSHIPAEKELRLKVGAQVMLIRNDSGAAKRYFNGKIGVVVAIAEELIEVRFEDKTTLPVGRSVWQAFDFGKGDATMEPSGEFTQFPLKLAWAVTIHKSQGLTFDRAVIDAGKSFTAGQVYVALSRVKSLAGLLLASNITRTSIQCSQDIVNYLRKPLSYDLKSELTKGKGQYWLSLLLSRFSLAPALELLGQILKKPDTYKQKVGVKTLTVLARVYESLTDLEKIYVKFNKDIVSRSEQAIDANYLEDRTAKAMEYFTGIIETDVQPGLTALASELKGTGTSLAEELTTSLQACLAGWVESVRQVEGLSRRVRQGDLETLIKDSRISQSLAKPSEGRSKETVLKAKRENLNKSLRASIDLLKAGKTVAEIAQERKLSTSTVENHFLEAAKSGEPVIRILLQASTYDEIVSVIAQVGTDVNDLVERLEGKYSFFEIRLALHLHLVGMNEDS